MSNVQALGDQQLVAQVQRGDRQAFSELVRCHYATIYRVCFPILLDREDAAHVTQEAFMRAYHQRSTFHNRRAFKAWMVCVTLNVSLHVRSQQRDGIPLDDLQLASGSSAKSVIVRAEVVPELYHALQALPFNHRVAVIHRD